MTGKLLKQVLSARQHQFSSPDTGKLLARADSTKNPDQYSLSLWQAAWRYQSAGLRVTFARLANHHDPNLAAKNIVPEQES